MFDKKLYWKRRNNSVGKGEEEVFKPLRGQGEKIKRTFEKSVGQHVHFTDDGTPVRLNRAQSRKLFRDRLFTRKPQINHKGKVIKKVHHKNGSKPFKPSLPPSITNNQRLKIKALGAQS